MLIWLCVTFFLAAFSLCAAAGYWLASRQTAVPASAGAGPGEELAQAPGTAGWLGLMARLGERLRVPENEQREKTRDLMALGMRGEQAARLFNGAKLLCAAGLPALLAIVFLGVLGADPYGALPALVLSVFVGFQLPDHWLRRRLRTRRREIARGIPDLLDLLVISLESGVSLDYALAETGRDIERAHPALAEELYLFQLELQAGASRRQALRNLGQRSGEPEMRRVASVLLQGDRFGTGIARQLRAHAKRVRMKRRQQAEEQAQKTPVKIIFPVFFLIMPALFLVTAGPAVLILISGINTFGR